MYSSPHIFFVIPAPIHLQPLSHLVIITSHLYSSNRILSRTSLPSSSPPSPPPPHPPHTPPLRQIFCNPVRLSRHSHHLYHFLTTPDSLHYDAFILPFITLSPQLYSYHHTNTSCLCHRPYLTYIMPLSSILSSRLSHTNPPPPLPPPLAPITVRTKFLIHSLIFFGSFCTVLDKSDPLPFPQSVYQTLHSPPTPNAIPIIVFRTIPDKSEPFRSRKYPTNPRSFNIY